MGFKSFKIFKTESMKNIFDRRLVSGECFNIVSTVLSVIRVRVMVMVKSRPAYPSREFWFWMHVKVMIGGSHVKGD